MDGSSWETLPIMELPRPSRTIQKNRLAGTQLGAGYIQVVEGIDCACAPRDGEVHDHPPCFVLVRSRVWPCRCWRWPPAGAIRPRRRPGGTSGSGASTGGAGGSAGRGGASGHGGSSGAGGSSATGGSAGSGGATGGASGATGGTPAAAAARGSAGRDRRQRRRREAAAGAPTADGQPDGPARTMAPHPRRAARDGQQPRARRLRHAGDPARAQLGVRDRRAGRQGLRPGRLPHAARRRPAPPCRSTTRPPTPGSWGRRRRWPLHHPMIAGVNGKLYSLGGQPNTNLTLEYDPVADTLDRAGAHAHLARRRRGRGHRHQDLRRRRPPAGGRGARPTPSRSTTSATDTWTTLPKLPARLNLRNHLAAAAIDGKIYVAGGRYNECCVGAPMTDALDVFDPATSMWTARRRTCAARAAASPASPPTAASTSTAARAATSASPTASSPTTTSTTRSPTPGPPLPRLPIPFHGVTGGAFVDGVIYMPGGGTSSGGTSGTHHAPGVSDRAELPAAVHGRPVYASGRCASALVSLVALWTLSPSTARPSPAAAPAAPPAAAAPAAAPGAGRGARAPPAPAAAAGDDHHPQEEDEAVERQGPQRLDRRRARQGHRPPTPRQLRRARRRAGQPGQAQGPPDHRRPRSRTTGWRSSTASRARAATAACWCTPRGRARCTRCSRSRSRCR